MALFDLDDFMQRAFNNDPIYGQYNAWSDPKGNHEAWYTKHDSPKSWVFTKPVPQQRFKPHDAVELIPRRYGVLIGEHTVIKTAIDSHIITGPIKFEDVIIYESKTL